MTIQTPIINLIETGSGALELEGLALALRIVVTDYIGDRSLEKCNALDALACALHASAQAHSQIVGKIGGACNV